MQKLIEAVRKFAEANYEKDGWDFLVECWEDEDIAEQICEDDTELKAIARCRRTVRAMNEQRESVRSEMW